MFDTIPPARRLITTNLMMIYRGRQMGKTRYVCGVDWGASPVLRVWRTLRIIRILENAMAERDLYVCPTPENERNQ